MVFEKNEYINSEFRNMQLTDSIVNDMLSKVSFKKLSPEEETIYIKKAKLSYYEEADDDLKELYIKYYGDVFPLFKEKYNSATLEEKENILKLAIEESRGYRDEFIINNLRLPLFIARKKASSYELENLWHEGIIGMFKALERFDVESGNKFSTYASWWINESINRYIYSKVPAVRIPTYLRQELHNLSKVKYDLAQKLGRIPTDDDYIGELNISKEKLKKLFELREMLYNYSLDVPTKDDVDKIENTLSSDFDLEITVEDSIIKEKLKKIISSIDLSYKEVMVLYLRYGFIGEKVYTLAEIGEVFGVTRERVRQIENKALDKIRNDKRITGLFFTDILDDDIISCGEVPENREIVKPKSELLIREILLQKNLSGFDLITQIILYFHYGLADIFIPIKEIANILNLTSEQLNRYEKEAFKKIRVSLQELQVVNEKSKKITKGLK